MHLPKLRDIKSSLPILLDKAIAVQGPLVRGHVERMRQADPSRTPQDVIGALEHQYLAAVASLGGAAGVAAAVPGVGLVAAVPLNVAEIGSVMQATVLYVLAVAHVHGVKVEDIERRRTLVLAILLGDAGSKAVEKIAGTTGPHWARLIVKHITREQLLAINKVLGRNFVTKYGTKQGILVLGRELPFGIGALIGVGGNGAIGYFSVRAARRVFGPPPDDWSPPVCTDDPAPGPDGHDWSGAGSTAAHASEAG